MAGSISVSLGLALGAITLTGGCGSTAGEAGKLGEPDDTVADSGGVAERSDAASSTAGADGAAPDASVPDGSDPRTSVDSSAVDAPEAGAVDANSATGRSSGPGFVDCAFDLYGEPHAACDIAAGEVCCREIDPTSLKRTGGTCGSASIGCAEVAMCDEDEDCPAGERCESVSSPGLGIAWRCR